MRRVIRLVLLLGVAALPAWADTIVLKSGRRITATQVFEEGDRVVYETPNGRMSLPKSVVARIERGGAPAWGDSSSSELDVPPPRLDPGEGYDDVVRATLRDGSIDRDYLARLEGDARSNSRDALMRVAVAHHVAGQFEMKRGEFDQAVSHYRRALTYVPDHAGLLLNLAYVYLRRSEFTPAIEQLDRARRVAPDLFEVAKLAGWAYYGANKIDQAVAEWKRALALRPDAEVERALAKALRDQEAEREYREGETRHFTLRYQGDAAAPALVRDILRTLEDHFNAIETELNFTPPESIGVILYTKEVFADITRAPGWVGALNDGRIRVPVQGLTSVPAEMSRVLKHELAHSFVAQKTRGRCPVWLNEGIAQWMEGARARESAATLVAAYEQKTHIPLGALEGSWMKFPGGVAKYAYAWSLAVVEYVVATYGIGDIERLLDRVATEPGAEDAARSTLRMGYSELEEETIKYIRRTYLR